MIENKEIYVQDDEIDLIELFKTVWGYRIYIVVITAIFGFLGFLYAFVIATPKYEVSAIFENGYYRNLPISGEKIPLYDVTSRIESLNVKWIKSLEGVPNLDFKFKKIELLKDDKNRFFVQIFANDNDIGISKVKEILAELEEEDKKELEIYKQNIQNQIDSSLEKIKNLKEKGISLENSLKIAQEESKNAYEKAYSFNDKIANQSDTNLELALAGMLDLQNRIENKILSLNNSIIENKTNIINEESALKNLEIKLLPNNYSVSRILSNIVTYDKATEPKKALILVISVFVGFFISMLGVLIYDVVKKHGK